MSVREVCKIFVSTDTCNGEGQYPCPRFICSSPSNQLLMPVSLSIILSTLLSIIAISAIFH